MTPKGRGLLRTAVLVALGTATTAGGAGSAGLSLPGRNGLIAFVRERSALSLGGRIFLMKADGSGPRALLAGRKDDDPAWSPDGRELAFVRDNDVYVVTFAGKRLRRLTRLRHDFAMSPTWSPDGRRIAFTGGLHDDLWVMNADGSGRHVLARATRRSAPNDFVGPRWSPTGREILFYATVTSAADQLFVVDADGRGRREITSGRQSHESPDWSPDGKRIVFVGPPRAPFTRPPGGGGLYVMNADGTGIRWLRTVGDAPYWSPDGRRIVFGRGNRYNGFEQLYIVDADGTNVHTLTAGHTDFGAAWQPLR